MRMKNEKKEITPKLRFSKYNSKWIIGNFNFDFLQTNSFSRAEMNDEKGRVKNIHYGDVLTKYSELLRGTSVIPFINGDIDLSKFQKKSYLRNGDIIIADTAEDLAAGKAIEVLHIDFPVLAGQHTFLCRAKTNFASGFMGYYLNSPSYHSRLVPLLTGTKVYSISKANIKNTFIIYPESYEEQQKIAECLSSIDELIDAESRKLVALKKYKKGFMQKLFPVEGKTLPEWRFPEFQGCGEWRISKLGNLCEITTGKLDANAMVTNGKYRFYTCAREFFQIDKYAFDTEALLISGNGANVGYIHYYNGKFNAYQRTYVLDQFCEYIHYIKYYLEQNLTDRINIEKNSGNMPYIVLKTLIDMTILLPREPKEQQKIAGCLSEIDVMITTQSDKVEQLKIHKKGLMQGLFPSLEEADI